MGLAGAKQGGVTACGGSSSTQAGRGTGRSPEPAQGAVPFDEHWVGQVQHRDGLRYRESPEAQFGRGWCKEGQGLLTAGGPIGASLDVVHPRGVATGGLHIGHQARAGGLYGRQRAAQSHEQKVLRWPGGGVIHPAAGVQRQRLAAPAVEQVQGCGLRHARAHQCGLGRGHRQHLERHLGDQPQAAQAADQQARNVIAGHVFHDLAAKGE